MTKLIKPKVEKSDTKNQKDMKEGDDVYNQTILPTLRLLSKEQKKKNFEDELKVSCQFIDRGCQQVFSVKDTTWHHLICQYAHYPHKNVHPNMPVKTTASQAKLKKYPTFLVQDVTSTENEKLLS